MSETLKHLLHPKFLHMTLLAFCAGIPFSLIYSSLGLWLAQVGVVKSTITMFSWAALGYSFKYLWSPLADKLPIPVLTKKFGQRRSWLLVSQVSIIVAIVLMAMTNPINSDYSLIQMAVGSTLLGFSAATQDISIDAWRIEAANEQDIAMMSSIYQAGYRLGMVTSGFGVLYLAGSLGTSLESYKYSAWQISYLLMAALILIGITTTLSIKEPKKTKTAQQDFTNRDFLTVLGTFIIGVATFVFLYNSVDGLISATQSFVTHFITNQTLINFILGLIKFTLSIVGAGLVVWTISKHKAFNNKMVSTVYWSPIADLFKRHRNHMLLLIGIICTYRISDIVMGVTTNIFYQDMGFSLQEIAEVTKFYGVIITILGGILGGVLVIKFGLLRIMIIGAILSALTNLLFMIMAEMDKNMLYLIFMILADNLAQGMALTAFIAFLSMLVNKQFTAVQYAMFSSVMTLFPKILGGYSGGMVEQMGYAQFYLMTAIIGIPVVLMLMYADKVNAFQFTKQQSTD